MSVVAFVPAKGSSDRVPNKNMRLLNGEPLFVFTLRKLLRCSVIDAVYLDSEDDDLLRIGARVGAIPLKRDPALATNETDGHALFANEILHVDADLYIQALCTSPFVKPETISRAVAILRTDMDYDSVVLGEVETVYAWEQNRPAYGTGRIPNSRELPVRYAEGMNLYAVKREVAHRTRRRIGERPYFLLGAPMEMVDVNTEADLRLAEHIAHGMLHQEIVRLNLLRTLLSTPILSDACEQVGAGGPLPPGYVCNLPGHKIFGRARTLEIGPVRSGDGDIYEALQSYHGVTQNDVLIVKNTVPGLAYFGELNARLAVRAGASGAVLESLTRDSSATRAMGFPVFARGYGCQDVRGHASVHTMHEPVTIGGQRVCASDLIFADQDGVMVIPYEAEPAILERALKIADQERGLVADIAQNLHVDELVKRHGVF